MHYSLITLKLDFMLLNMLLIFNKPIKKFSIFDFGLAPLAGLRVRFWT